MEKYLVSSCMAGIPCRYNGTDKKNEIIHRLLEEGKAIPVCPEVLGGLSIPREPAECRIINGEYRVISKSGKDVTAQYKKGAEEALKIAKKYGIKRAILQAKSPSCGKITYDGTFTGTLADYPGVTVKFLKDNGIEIISSDEIENYFKFENI